MVKGLTHGKVDQIIRAGFQSKASNQWKEQVGNDAAIDWANRYRWQR